MREGLELVYIYIAEMNYDVCQIELNFSNDKEFAYSEKDNHITFTDIKTSVSHNFFGNNINNVSALIGSNGVGKTSIINILGFLKSDRFGLRNVKILDVKYAILYFDRKEKKFYCENYLNPSNIGSNVELSVCVMQDNAIIFNDADKNLNNLPAIFILNSNSNSNRRLEVIQGVVTKLGLGNGRKIDLFDFLYSIHTGNESVYDLLFNKKERNRLIVLSLNPVNKNFLAKTQSFELYDQGNKLAEFWLSVNKNKSKSDFSKRFLVELVYSIFSLKFYEYEDVKRKGEDPKRFYENICSYIDYFFDSQDFDNNRIISLLSIMLESYDISNKEKFILLLSKVLQIFAKIQDDFIYISHSYRDMNRVYIRAYNKNVEDLRNIAEYIDCYNELLYKIFGRKNQVDSVIDFDFLD